MNAQNIDRRRLLVGLAAASTAAAAPAVATAATLNENSELLRLADVLVEREGKYLAAREAARAIYAEWNPRLPRCPDEISGWGRESVRDLAGGAVRNGEDPLRRQTADDLEWLSSQERLEKNLRRKKSPKSIAEVKRWHARICHAYKLAKAYEVEHERVVQASGYREAVERKSQALQALGEVVVEIMKQPDGTMSDVMVKAHALAAWGKVDYVGRLRELTICGDDQHWGSMLAASIMRLSADHAKAAS